MALRLDRGTLGSVKRTPQGGLRAPAYLTRTGVFVYRRADGTEIREWRPPEEVFHEDALASLADAPVTDLHPPRMVDGKTYRQYAAGHVSGGARRDGDKVEADLVIQDATLVGAVERRDRTEVSCGYVCEVEEKAGVTPEGERYDRVQRQIRYNHVAVVPRGRAGSEVALRLDASGDVVYDTEVEPEGLTYETRTQAMKMIRIDGVEYPLGTEAEQTAAVAAMGRKMDADEAERAKLEARADAAEAELEKARKELEEAKDPARLDALVEAKAQLRADAAKHLDEVPDTDAEIKAAVVAKAFSDVKLDGKPEAYVDGMYEAALRALDAKRPRSDAEDARRVARPTPDSVRTDNRPEPRKDARAELIQAHREASQAPLAVSAQK